MPGEATEKVTYCRVCEPLCGMVATVEDGRLTKLRPDSDHPLSAGFACPKGIAMTDVQNDPDRVLHPMRRNASGEFERVSWGLALDEIGDRLGRIRAEHGGGASPTRSDRPITTPLPRRTSAIASPRARCSTARRS
jgi:anaerobic selenocysteine-containing dehydrogenase